MSAETPCPKAGEFSWNELLTTDVAAAKTFYAGLFGWTGQPFAGPTEYTIFKQGDTMVGGLMKCPHGGMPAHWLSYVTVADVDQTAAKAKSLGGQLVLAPFDVPTVGRVAVVTDPQGAAIGLFKPQM
jgi:predicted enzyme related to lactoylglutathione lyase